MLQSCGGQVSSSGHAFASNTSTKLLKLRTSALAAARTRPNNFSSKYNVTLARPGCIAMALTHSSGEAPESTAYRAILKPSPEQ
jgi:hypothetical protein